MQFLNIPSHRSAPDSARTISLYGPNPFVSPTRFLSPLVDPALPVPKKRPRPVGIYGSISTPDLQRPISLLTDQQTGTRPYSRSVHQRADTGHRPESLSVPRKADIKVGELKHFFSDDWGDDEFEEVCVLGGGGRVRKVRYKRNGMIMARKTIAILNASKVQLARELKVASTAKHLNIVTSYGVYMSPSQTEIKILMEFCSGRSLDAVGEQMKQSGMIVDEKIYGRLAEGILQGLNYLHGIKTIHRSIRPQNVLLSQEGIVKLCDFGISGDLLNSYAATYINATIYMSPERISGADYTIRSDVWSTGITLLELVQNRCPFPSDLTTLELMTYITSNDPPRLEDEDGRYWSDEMKDLFKQTLNIDPHVRPTPKDTLQHLWITTVMEQEVDMAQWIRTVWPKRRHSRLSTKIKPPPMDDATWFSLVF